MPVIFTRISEVPLIKRCYTRGVPRAVDHKRYQSGEGQSASRRAAHSKTRKSHNTQSFRLRFRASLT